MPDLYGYRRLRRRRAAGDAESGYRSLGPYKIPYAKVEAHGVYTNTVPAGAFRGFGALQVTWAYESQMDMIADRLGLDPLDFRLKNVFKKGDIYTVGDTPVDCDMSEGLLKVAEPSNGARRATDPNRAKASAAASKMPAAPTKSPAPRSRCRRTAAWFCLTGTVEVGQGARTALSQVVAEELSIPLEQITVAQLDTDVTPYDISTSASSSMVVMGHRSAARRPGCQKQLLQCAAKDSQAESR